MSPTSGLSGSTTAKVNIGRAVGTGTIAVQAAPEYPSFIMVEDITYETPPSSGGVFPTAGAGMVSTSGVFNVVAEDSSLLVNADAMSVQNNGVTNLKLADMPALTFKGNDTGAASDPRDLTIAQSQVALKMPYVYSASTAYPYGSALPAGTRPYIICGTYTTTTTAGGVYNLYFPQAFPNGLIAFNVTCIGGAHYLSTAGRSGVTNSYLVFYTFGAGGGIVANTSVDVTYIAIGW